MHTINKLDKVTAVKKVYQRPALTTLGSVQQLTLKVGSLTDGQNAGSFQ